MCHTASGDNSREPRALCSISRKTKLTLRPKLGSVKTTNTADLMKVLHSGLRRAPAPCPARFAQCPWQPPPPSPPAESPHRHPVPPHVLDSPTFSRPSPVFRGFDLVCSPASGSLPLPASNEEPSSPPVSPPGCPRLPAWGPRPADSCLAAQITVHECGSQASKVPCVAKPLFPGAHGWNLPLLPPRPVLCPTSPWRA